MSTPTVPDSHADLLTSPHTGALATLGPDGRPQVTALWYLYDPAEGVVRISLNDARQKFKNVRARPVATLFVMDPANSQRTIEVRGDVSIEPDPDYAFADRVSAHYGGFVDLRTVDQPGQSRHIVTLTPVKINTWG